MACRPSAGMPRPAWQRIVSRLLLREREDGLQVRMVEREALGARVQLDPAGTRGECPLGLGERGVVRVEAAEGE